MGGRFKNKFAIGAAALAAAAFAGGAYAATQSGSTSRKAFFDDVAKRLNVTPDQLQAAFRAALIDRINAAVAAGRLTQAQANKLEQRIKEGKLPMFFGPRLRPGLMHSQLKAAASYLGLTEVQLLGDLRSGKSLAQVAKDQGKTTGGLEAAMTAAFKARLDKAVSAGGITSAQEQQILSRYRSHLDARVNRSPHFGRYQGLRAVPGMPPQPGGWGESGGWGAPGGPGGADGSPPPGSPPPGPPPPGPPPAA